MRQLYISVALPKITYGLEIWYTPPHKKPGLTKNSGSASALRQLQKIQRIASLAINGALRTTPTDFLDVHAGILPIESALLKASHRAAIRLLTLPDSHPLHSIIEATRNKPPSKHSSPIANLIRIFKLSHKRVETILPTAQCPKIKQKFSTGMAGSRKDSIEMEKEDTADFKVFSDGSGTEDGIGAAAILFKKGRFTPLSQLKVFLGAPSKHNTFEAEVVGAILATRLISATPDAVGKKVTLYIDNQSVIASLKSPKATSGQHLIRHTILSANSLACTLSVRWISSHSKVRGNEKVDELAKEAANGLSSEEQRLPHILRTPLPLGASAIKQHFAKKLKYKWEDDWEESERGRRFRSIDEVFPFSSFRKRTHALTRSQASLMIQLRSGHIPLNGYLSRINRADSDLCQACLEEDENLQCRETVKHFLFECTAYNKEREELTKQVSRRHLNLKDIMSDADRMKALARYVNRTGRFKEKQQG
jgi:ribonuclease HI